jgi:hypothetical protein
MPHPIATRSAAIVSPALPAAVGMPTPVGLRPPTPPKAVLAFGCAQQGGVVTARRQQGNERIAASIAPTPYSWCSFTAAMAWSV